MWPKIIIKFFITATLIIWNASAYACKLPNNSSFFWNDKKLIEKTKDILLVEVTQIAPLQKQQNHYAQMAKYTFSVLEVLKGNFDKKTLTSTNFSLKPSGKEYLQNGHGRSFYAPDCHIYEYGELHKKYILFLNAFHPHFFKEINNKNDPWYKTIKSILKHVN